ncbi:N-acetylmuramoyl-L-alanine amidase [Croceicoccus sp. F390]|uniref:N-acetylmuramoyl-L-alanine amidase n=1 Tax=Croceicoccus esteveae TaxID=3075597 RepID=A0ABU2ZEJ0_9SPHN|nr:N-acetylmuramoyl-L-alanine amidase [Croceicoccus sp. F390]MDT0574626.1 N-acetylmuramoyl-L-alanine amidase [Croceicoccus sp. F390]
MTDRPRRSSTIVPGPPPGEIVHREIASPNHDVRTQPVSMVVLHYTDMLQVEEAIARMCDPASKVSAHYCISRAGEVVRLVPETRRAWHAGKSYWRGHTDVNSASVGIELDNPGHTHGYVDFAEPQIQALILLLADIVTRHDIARANVVGHCDVAPARKIDPGERFPWERLARLRLALPRPGIALGDPFDNDGAFYLALERFGYDITDPAAAVRAFQRRFRPEAIDGQVDGQVRALLFALLLDRDKGLAR